MRNTSPLVQFDLPAVEPVDRALERALGDKIDAKTKPRGALGELETLALRLGLMQNSLTPTCTQPSIAVFAADHGLSAEGVSPYPQTVTAQMVANFLAGGAAINVFAAQFDIVLRIVDAGVAHPIPGTRRPVDAHIAAGTRNALTEPAMTGEQLGAALRAGAAEARALLHDGANVIGLGEMGIGNTSSAALLMHLLTGTALEHCTGRGTGLDDRGLAHKLDILERVASRARASLPTDPHAAPLEVMRQCGGFEIAMMTGAMVQAASERACIVIDGFIATAALLVARAIRPAVADYCVFAHVSDEHGHAAMLQYLKVRPLLNLGLRLGEGTGAALAIPLLRAATRFLTDMASFESAGVSERD